ncbi:hypothetical protein [Ferrimicrobium sp.]|uniref:hypothetical protein n=1 Tax=Ferrimicrobium sp. TaxID=2926050 RepID=UPI002607C344|nr:hypothetical protein [Ferrimicrobium sp.]
MQLGRIVRDYQRAYDEALAFLEEHADEVQTNQQVLAWIDGPTLMELSTHLSEVLGLVTIEQLDYLGAPYVLNPNRRSATLQVARRLSLHALCETILRCWGATGPISTESPNTPERLISVAEQGGTYPIPSAMATALISANPQLRADPSPIIAAIAESGYERLWAIGFSQLQ